MSTYSDGELEQNGGGGRAQGRATTPGRSTATSRLGASPASIARAVLAQLQADPAAERHECSAAAAVAPSRGGRPGGHGDGDGDGGGDAGHGDSQRR
jgi:hypothetical protein